MAEVIAMATLQQSLMSTSAQVISCDMFDTLIFRKSGTPHGLWRRLAERAYEFGLWPLEDTEAFVRCRQQAEREARDHKFAKAGHREVTLAEIYACWPQVNSEALYELEQHIEVQDWCLNTTLIAMLKTLQQQGRRLVITSDMYLPEVLIRSFWQQSCPDLEFSDVLISGECSGSKVDGLLYQMLIARSKVLPEQILHLGDHPIADGQMARAAGLQTLVCSYEQRIDRLEKLENRLVAWEPEGLALYRKRWWWANISAEKTSELGGLVFAPALYAWAAWVARRCQQLGVKTLFCFRREGELVRTLLSYMPWVGFEVKTLAVSRRSTFLPVRGQCNTETLYQLAARRGYTLAELADDVGLAVPDALRQQQTQPLTLLVSQTIWHDIAAWIESEQTVISTYLAEQRSLLQRYLAEQGVDNLPNVALLDWGCGGSLFANLAKVLPLDQVRCFMFYQSSKAAKVALFQHLEVFQPWCRAQWAEVIAAYPEVCEILLNGLETSTCAYFECNERVQPVSVQNSADTSAQKAQFDAFHTAVLSFASLAAAEGWLKEGVSLDERERFFAILYRLIRYPGLHEALVLQHLPVPLSKGESAPLLAHRDISLLQSLTTNVTEAFELGRSGGHSLVSCSWWYPGLIPLAFPGNEKALGELVVDQDDDVVAPGLLEQTQRADIHSLVLYGAGSLGQRAMDLLTANGIRVKAVVDRRAEHSDFELNGVRVETLARVLARGENCFAVASRAFASEISAQLRQALAGNSAARIVLFYEVQ
ncbi:hypothetical protein C4K68_05140 [Pokkaliibacter plantistimulans]|uniref:HAD family hydrolase n=1 Tax=Proteobacteria bacterium 228 TaxID=2083153 RepID=A0A2S5KUM2_9PROT|nr:hypothetical protein [Pokkaliibacter plantistimulans]PPC78438.1 hypothetical protein C4K68_05140 [Pokkaliibacter plantistimulans]